MDSVATLTMTMLVLRTMRTSGTRREREEEEREERRKSLVRERPGQLPKTRIWLVRTTKTTLIAMSEAPSARARER